MYLHEIKIGDTFKVADVEFIKFTNDGNKVIAVSRDILYNFKFGDNANLAESNIKAKLEREFMPKLEAEVGADHIFEFETDLLALDGTRPFPNVKSKVSLVTFDFYRHNRELFGKYTVDDYWWLATPDSETYKDIVLCVAPSGNVCINLSFYDRSGVRPFLIFSSSISVS